MPSPELTWYLNGDEILPNNRIFMNTDGIDYKLIFNHIKISDEGEIKAVAKNLLGEIETSGSVVVEGKKQILYFISRIEAQTPCVPAGVLSIWNLC